MTTAPSADSETNILDFATRAAAATMSAMSTEPGSTASNPSPTSPASAPSRDPFHGRLFDVMLDLETMGNKPGAAIVAIGAVKFNQDGILDRFYCTVDLQSCLHAGLVIDASTVMWWMRQNDEARNALQYPGYMLPDALTALKRWLHGIDNRNDYCVWGNGADFDNAIIACAYAAVGAPLPWDFWRNRCYRTMKSMSSMQIERRGTHYNALDDAESQALHLLRILA